MKIGILTHHYIDNYGAFLQGWALREAIQNLYPNDEVQIINFINIKHFIINIGGWFRFYKDKENFHIWHEKTKVPSTFSGFRKANLKSSKLCFTANQVNRLNYDCIVIGSDEVWNIKDNKGRHPIKFGKGLECENLIAYAPSVGQTNPNENLPEYVLEGIKRFKAISSRDELTYELTEKVTGNTPTRVLDPTFLSEFPKATLKGEKPYILFYYCEHLPVTIKEQIFSYAKTHGLKIYGAGETDREYSEITVNLTPFEWVEMFRSAEFVFTGTFHGTVFSILNKRQFKVYLTNQSRIKKVGALLNDLYITEREIKDDFIFDLDSMKKEIDYQSTFEIIDKKRTESLQFLKDSIGGF